MRAYEFPARVTEDGITIAIPPELEAVIPLEQEVRVLVLLPEPTPYDTDVTPEEEHAMWLRFAAEQALKQYSEADAIYDQV